MMTKKKRIMVLILIIIFVILIFTSIFVLLYLKTDMFKSSKILFTKYLGQNMENFKNIESIIDNNEEINICNETIEAKINYTEKIGTTEENTENSINNLKIISNGQIDNNNNYNYKNIELLKNDEKISNVEYLEANNNYGIKFTDLFNQYLVSENTNLKEIFRKMGYTDEQLQNIPDSVNLKSDLINDVKFNEEELKNIEEKYIGIISQNILDTNFTTLKNQQITVNGQNYVANAHVLNLTKEQLNNIYINLLETIKEDEIILNKVDILQNRINEITLGKNDINLKSELLNYINKTIQKINQKNIGSDETKIIVYENKGKTIRTRVETQEYQTNIDYLQLQNGNFAQILVANGEDDKYIVTINNNDNDLSIVIENKVKGNTINFTRKKENDNQKNIEEYDLIYEISDKKVDFNVVRTLENIQNIENIQSFNDENSVKLDNLNEEQTKQIMETVRTQLDTSFTEIKQKVEYEDIEKMLKDLGIIKEVTILGSSGEITETEKNRFNSIFELLQGENITGENVLNSIKTIESNIGGVEIASGNELRIKIVRENPNEEVIKILTTFFEEHSNDEYNIAIQYDESGLVSELVLTIVNDE